MHVKKADGDRIQGCIEAVDGPIISGWVADAAGNLEPTSLLLIIDEFPLATFVCSEPRNELNALGFQGRQLGFRFEIPAAYQDGALHSVSVRSRSGEVLPYQLASGERVSRVPFAFRPTSVQGVVDGITGCTIRGWAFRTDLRSNAKETGVSIEVRANGLKIGFVKATLIRNDVSEAHGCPPNCGFVYSVPPRFRDGKAFILEFFAVPEGHQLHGSPFSGSVFSQDTSSQLHGIFTRIEDLATQLYGLKDVLRRILEADEYTTETYSSWAARYFQTLKARVADIRRRPIYASLMVESPPLISVVCPTYRPILHNFVAAVNSVLAQSWERWELIIVDDGSASVELNAVIQQFVASDNRVRAISHVSNGGISRATNSGIEIAMGEFVVFLDHDDLLVDVALEVMTLEARHSGASIIYSDEDKIDEFGCLVDPYFKTDWNYRLLLCSNYVCHLLMVKVDLMKQVGQLNPERDGAQDHDVLLRLSELINPDQVHHVPEILYHWRKGTGSTAAAQSAKTYSVEAGRLAITDHLSRMGLDADIRPLYDSTLYDVKFRFNAEPSVSILIPFKDQLETTRRCVECILQNTGYTAFELVLIDNWSVEASTLAWLQAVSTDPRVRVMRIEENFNFSRLNNLAAQQVDSELLLFMNNDIFVAQPDWLSLMVGEALADPHVGIVGIKLVYPNQTVQHAGVVLGVGGVADHTFRYHPRDERGYAFRAVTASDMSAVTAACMLCRTDAFRAVGMFDEQKLAVAFNDVDLCLKIRQAGYRVVFTPAVVAEHHESLSRGSDLADHNLSRFYDENQTMWDRWGELLRNDPFYNPHFSHETGIYEKLSSASLDAARAPSLLHIPVKRATLTVAPPLKISHIGPSRTSRAGENGKSPVAEGATGPRKRSGKVDRTGSRVSGKPTVRRLSGAAAPTE